MDENQFSMDVDEVVWTLVKRGFAEGKDEIGESFRQMYEDVDNVPSQEVVEAAVDAALNRFRDEMDSWPVETDCDRLTQAFEQLEEEGRIVAREDFSCCQSCGRSEIGDDVEDLSVFHGFVFYHNQDTDGAVEGGSLFLAFGTFKDEGDAAAIRIGRKICDVLAAHELETEWNGSNKTRIIVHLDWKRRLPWLQRRDGTASADGAEPSKKKSRAAKAASAVSAIPVGAVTSDEKSSKMSWWRAWLPW